MIENSVNPRMRAGDPFPAAQDQDHPHACGGVVFIGHLVEEDGEEVEVFEAVRCRRCAEEAR